MDIFDCHDIVTLISNQLSVFDNWNFFACCKRLNEQMDSKKHKQEILKQLVCRQIKEHKVSHDWYTSRISNDEQTVLQFMYIIHFEPDFILRMEPEFARFSLRRCKWMRELNRTAPISVHTEEHAKARRKKLEMQKRTRARRARRARRTRARGQR